MKVSEIMIEVITSGGDITLERASKIMKDKDISSIVIVDDNEVKGIVSDKDISNNIKTPKKNVKKVMTKDVTTVDSDEDVDRVAELMNRKKIDKLPVVEDDKLIGIVTADQIVEHSDELNEDFFFG